MRPITISPRTLCGAIVIATVSGTTLAAPAPASPVSQSLRWANGISDQLNIMTPAQLKGQLDQLATRKNATRVLVTLTQAITANERAALQAQGLTLLSSLGSTNYFATLSNNADTASLSRSTLASVSSIKAYQKLHKDLIAGVIHPWAVSNQGPVAKSSLKDRVNTESILLDEYERVGVDPTIAVVVMFHKDAHYNAHALRLANQLGAKVASEIYSVNSVILHMPASRLQELASDDAVMWVEPPLPEMSTLNAENRVLTGVNTLQTAPYNLDGSGVSVLIYDAGQVLSSHQDFGGRVTIGQSDTSSVINHSTHVAGTVGGDGSASSGNNRGMAPAVDLISYGFEVVGGLQAGFLYTDPGDLEADYSEAIGLYGAHLANNSIGTNTAPNGYPCDWTGNYGITSALIDSIVAGSLGSPFRIVWANGNERGSFNCQGDDNGNFGEFYSTAPPACAKNHITVGSVDSNTDLTSYFSSWGPTDDGRIKPDISAPGCQSNGDGGVTSTSSSGGYATMCGTSMAAPTTTGIAALILQQYRATFPDRTDLRNSTLKALLANTADDSGNTGPDYKYGYGSIRAIDAIDTVIEENIIEADVAQGDTYRFIVIHDGVGDLKVTIAWDDVPGAPNVSPSLVNDLDLKIIDANNNIHLPWTLNPSSPNTPAVRTARDALNNIEQVAIDNAPAGAYTVEVTGFNIAQGSTQSFGAVANGFLVNCSSAGFVSMGSQLVQCSGSTNVRVVDCDLNTSDLVVDTVNILISSDSDAGFMLTLTESTPESAEFVASFTFSDNAASDLLVSEGDTILASYTDLDNGQGGSNIVVEATMNVDCTPPTLLRTSTPLVSSDFAQINVQTDEPSNIIIRYGTSMGTLNQVIESNGLLTDHLVTIQGLNILTQYFYTVQATDQPGNSINYSNNGNGYAFNTLNGPVPVYEFLVDNTNPAWSTTNQWAFGQPTGNGGDPSSGDTDNNVYGYNLNGEYPNNLSQQYLTTDPLDFTDVTDVSIQFQRWLGVENSTWDHASIQARSGGGSWQTIWDHNGGTFQETSWNPVSYDVSSIADGQPDFQVRWVMGTTDGSVTYSGWNIDDIVFQGVRPEQTCQADFTGDGTLDFFDISTFLTLFSANDPSADINNDAQWDFFDISTFLTLFSAGCP